MKRIGATHFAAASLLVVIAAGLVGAGTGSATVSKHALRYTITDLTPNAVYAAPTGINNRGEVVGYLRPAVETREVGFRWSHGTTSLLPVPQGVLALGPTAINDSGAIVGTAYSNGASNGFVAVADQVRILTELDTATGINNLGLIVGQVTVAGQLRAAVDDRGRVRIAVAPPAHPGPSVATDINDSGTAAGTAYDQPPERGSGAFSFRRRLVELGTLGGPSSSAQAINNLGAIVGQADSKTGTHAYVYELGQMRDIGALFALDVNDLGDIVGEAFTSLGAGTSSAVIWRRGKMIDLNTTVPPGSGWFLNFAEAINNRGEIVGGGFVGGAQHAFLLRPA